MKEDSKHTILFFTMYPMLLHPWIGYSRRGFLASAIIYICRFILALAPGLRLISHHLFNGRTEFLTLQLIIKKDCFLDTHYVTHLRPDINARFKSWALEAGVGSPCPPLSSS